MKMLQLSKLFVKTPGVFVKILPVALLLFLSAGCTHENSGILLIPEANFHQVVDGKTVSLYTLKNNSGMVAQVTNYGARLVSLWTAGKDGKFDDVVLGYDSLSGYLNNPEEYFGATIGRYANRIAHGQFTLNGVVYNLNKNDGDNTIHGGIKGFNAKVWDARQVDGQTIEFSYLSPDGEDHFPGNLQVKVVYTLTDSNELKIDYRATTDKATLANLTNHSYFNLHGAGNGDVKDLVMQINADRYTPVDSTLIPTGEIAEVGGTPLDFRNPTAIGERLNSDFIQIKYGYGYDHNWVLNTAGDSLQVAARVFDPVSGRVMEVLTNEPGVQFYSAFWLDGRIRRKQDKRYPATSAFCLETQHFPDSPNHADFPSTILEPGKEYYSVCVFKFSIN